MDNYKIDIPVLLIFFNRPNKLEKVFESVQKAKPSRLYLYQDGAREGRIDDIENVNECRRIASNINWECDVKTFYQNSNLGCDPSEYIAQKWFFDNEEMGIVLEDDDVPCQSFYPFCKELLERYKNDNRIAIICGMNSFDIEQSCKESYLFCKTGSIWGWASWKRFIDLWDKDYSWITDKDKNEKTKNYCDFKSTNFMSVLNTSVRHKESGREHYESIMFAAAAQNNMLNIVPKYNMISNIGVGGESTHGASNIKLLPKRTQRLLNKKTYEINFPLTHPFEVKRNFTYENRYKINRFQRICDTVEVALRNLIFAGPKLFFQKIMKHLKS